MIAKGGWVYIMSSRSRCLYIGVTSDLSGRVWEHKNGLFEGFTKKYKINQLVYHELFRDIESAIAREKQLKGWRRAKKIALIEKMNPVWEDLPLSDAM
jgi:putative endonuclease